jgi:hypothetical protein
MTDTPVSTPAGWFTDPAGSGQLRWWDGSAWTAHLVPQPTPEPALAPIVVAPAPVPTPVVVSPVQTEQVHSVSEFAPVAQPFQGSPSLASWGATPQAGAYGMGVTDDFARPAQWNTVGAWLLAFSGLLSLAAATSHGLMTGFAITSAYDFGGYLGGYAVVFLLTLLFAEADRRKLRSLGYLKIPSLWWMLLAPPLIYLILRTVSVWGEVRKGIAPLITYFVVNVACGILISVGVVLLLPGMAALGTAGLGTAGLGTSTQFAVGIAKGLDENGGNYAVVCPRAIPNVIGSVFSCRATNRSNNVAHTMEIQVVEGTNGRPTVKLLSVTPPITG